MIVLDRCQIVQFGHWIAGKGLLGSRPEDHTFGPDGS